MRRWGSSGEAYGDHVTQKDARCKLIRMGTQMRSALIAELVVQEVVRAALCAPSILWLRQAYETDQRWRGMDLRLPRWARETTGIDVYAAAWVARCVGRAEAIPLGEADLLALASLLSREEIEAGKTIFERGDPIPGVWIGGLGLSS